MGEMKTSTDRLLQSHCAENLKMSMSAPSVQSRGPNTEENGMIETNVNGTDWKMMETLDHIYSFQRGSEHQKQSVNNDTLSMKGHLSRRE